MKRRSQAGTIAQNSESAQALELSPSGRPILPDPQLEVEKEVWVELKEFLRGDARFVVEAMSRRNAHYEIIERIFRDEGIPIDLLNVALIESSFRLDARSSAGAVGMWQFTRQTARVYGLRVDKKTDQRKDVVLSTLAAARHFRDLYAMYGDWNLVLAAYNAGPGAVNRAVQKTGAGDYWTIVRSGGFCTQTSRFVPRFIAASLLVRTLDTQGKGNVKDNVIAYIAEADLDRTGGLVRAG